MWDTQLTIENRVSNITVTCQCITITCTIQVLCINDITLCTTCLITSNKIISLITLSQCQLDINTDVILGTTTEKL